MITQYKMVKNGKKPHKYYTILHCIPARLQPMYIFDTIVYSHVFYFVIDPTKKYINILYIITIKQDDTNREEKQHQTCVTVKVNTETVDVITKYNL